jgi:hypothetical protein
MLGMWENLRGWLGRFTRQSGWLPTTTSTVLYHVARDPVTELPVCQARGL